MRTVTRLVPALLLASSLVSPILAQDNVESLIRRTKQDFAEWKLAAKADGVDAVLPNIRVRIEEIARLQSSGRLNQDSVIASTGATLVGAAEILADAGRIEEAREALQGRVAGVDVALAQQEPLAGQLANSDIAQRLQALGEHQEAPLPTVEADVLFIVENALAKGNQAALRQLGPSITETLAYLCLEATNAAQLLSTALEPYVWLCEASPERAYEVGLALLAREGSGWPTVVANGVFQQRTPTSSVRTLLFDSNDLDPKALALAERLLASDEVRELVKARVVRAVLSRDSNASFARTAGLELVEGGDTSSKRVLDTLQLGAWHRSLLSSDRPTARRWAAQVLADRSGMELIEELAGSEDADLRRIAATKLDSTAPSASSAGPRVVALWKRLLDDSDADVRTSAWQSYAEAYSNSHTCPVDPETAADLALLFTSDEPGVQLTDAAHQPLRFISWIGRSAGDELARGAALGRLVGAEDVEVSQSAFSAIRNLDDSDAVVAAACAFDWKGRGGRFTDWFASTLAQRAKHMTPAFRVSLYAQLVQVEGLPTELLDALCPHGRGGPNDISLPLDDLEPERAVDTYLAAIRVYLRHAWEMRYDTDWARLESEVGRVLARGSLGALERGALGITRFDAYANAERVDFVHDAIREVAQMDAKAAAELASQATSALREHGTAGLGLIAALAKDPALPNEALQSLYVPDPESPAYGQPVAEAAIDALVERAAKFEPETVPFAYAGRNWIDAMCVHPRLFRVEVVRRWATESRNVGRAGAAAHAAGAMDVVEEMRERAAELLMNAGAYDYNVQQAIGRLGEIPGTDIAPYLLAFASSTQSQSARELVLTRLEQMARVKDMEARFGAEVSPEAKHAKAVRDTLALLEHSNEAVRVQAIRGLATLGAVEELPRLIGFVSDGSKAEKEAAMAALDALHDQATSAK